MKLWSLQPNLVAAQILSGEPFTCDPELSNFVGLDDFIRSYAWLMGEMELQIPRPEHVLSPVWAWYKNYGANTKPDRRRQMFKGYDGLDSILELEVPSNEVLLTDFDDWHAVLNNCEIVSDEEWYANQDREYTAEEKAATWQRIFEVEEKDFVQACVWEIKPEHLVKVHAIKQYGK